MDCSLFKQPLPWDDAMFLLVVMLCRSGMVLVFPLSGNRTEISRARLLLPPGNHQLLNLMH